MAAKLTYFDVRGRAEIVRLLLEETATEYTERRVSLEEWPEIKPNVPCGQLPLYEEDGLVINQSHAIYRYLGRKFDMYGDTELDRIRCDIVEETFVDLQNNIAGFFWNPDFEKLRYNYESVDLPAMLARVEALLEDNVANSGYWVGKRLSFIDFVAWHYLDYVRAFSQKTLDRFVKLNEFKQSIDTRPRIAAYLKSDRRQKTLTVALCPYGGTPETS